MNYQNKYLSNKTQKGFQEGTQKKSDFILDQLNQRQLDKQQSAINSAALQDHIMKNYKLNLLDPFKKKNPNVKPSYSNLNRQTSFQNNARNILQNQNTNQQSQISQQSPQIQQNQTSVVKILENHSQKDENVYNDIEKKRLQYISHLSLAQRLGLVEKPPLPLSQNQWKEIEQQSLNRFHEKEPCPICYEDLRFQDQTILSCSHVFHKTCLESFEKFMKNKGNEKLCPICRKKDYDQKTYVEGQKFYLIKCIKKIQKLVKGFIARNKFYSLIKQSGIQPKHPSLKKKFIGFKLSRIGKRYIDHMKRDRQAIVEMVQNLDKNIKDTEALLESFLPNVPKILQTKRQQQIDQEEQKNEQKLSKFWQDIKNKALKRGDKDCPICYNNYTTNKEVCLLNCSHMYHKCCLESFEKYDYEQQICCPMCRLKDYKKIVIKV